MASLFPAPTTPAPDVGALLLDDWIAEIERDVMLAEEPAPIAGMCRTYAALRELRAARREAQAHG